MSKNILILPNEMLCYIIDFINNKDCYNFLQINREIFVRLFWKYKEIKNIIKNMSKIFPNMFFKSIRIGLENFLNSINGKNFVFNVDKIFKQFVLNYLFNEDITTLLKIGGFDLLKSILAINKFVPSNFEYERKRLISDKSGLKQIKEIIKIRTPYGDFSFRSIEYLKIKKVILKKNNRKNVEFEKKNISLGDDNPNRRVSYVSSPKRSFTQIRESIDTSLNNIKFMMCYTRLSLITPYPKKSICSRCLMIADNVESCKMCSHRLYTLKEIVRELEYFSE